MPRVTIGLAVYNGERFLEEAIDAILMQSYEDFELLLGDNGSTDRTVAICQAAAERDPRVRYLRSGVNRGAAWNHNRLVDAATGEYFMWAAHDDLYSHTYVEDCVRVLDEHPDTAYVLAAPILMDEGGVIQGIEANRQRLDARSPVVRFWDVLVVRGGHTTYGVARTALLRRIAPHRTVPRAERILYAELALHGPFRLLDTPGYFRRLHPGQTTQTRSDRAREAVVLDPDRARWRRHQTPVLVAEYVWGFLDAVRHAPLSRQDKLRCMAALAAWVIARAVPRPFADRRTRDVQIDRTYAGESVTRFLAVSRRLSA